MMPLDESMEAIGQEIRALSKRYYCDGFKDYQQRTMDEIKSKYNPEVYYGHLSDASLLFHKAHIDCYWLTGGWLFREDKEGDVEIHVSDNADSHSVKLSKENNTENQMTSFFDPTFQDVHAAEKRLQQRSEEFQQWYRVIIGEFVRLLFEEQPDVDAIRDVMKRMREGVSPEMSETQVAAVLLKAVAEELRLRCNASLDETDPICLVHDLQFLLDTEFMEPEKRTVYFEDCYNQLLHAAALFFWEGASYAQWKSVVNQVFEVGSGRKVEDTETELDIIMRFILGNRVPVSEEQVALDIILRLLQTMEEMRQEKHKEDIEKVKARLAEKAEKKNSGGKRAVH